MKFLIGFFFILASSLSTYAANNCLIFDEYNKISKSTVKTLKAKGFQVTSEYPYGQDHFTLTQDTLWNDTIADELKAEIYCFEVTNYTYGFRQVIDLNHSSVNLQSIDTVKGNLVFKCTDTSKGKIRQRQSETLNSAVNKLKSCSDYQKRLKRFL